MPTKCIGEWTSRVAGGRVTGFIGIVVIRFHGSILFPRLEWLTIVIVITSYDDMQDMHAF